MKNLYKSFYAKDNLKLAYSYVKAEQQKAKLSAMPTLEPGHRAVTAAGDDLFIALSKFISRGAYSPQKVIHAYAPKDNLGLRPIALLSLVDRITYQAIFNPNVLGHHIDNQLSIVSYSNRINKKEDPECYLEPYIRPYDKFIDDRVKAYKKGFVWMIELDVQQFYENIPHELLLKTLDEDFSVPGLFLQIIRQMLETWKEHSVASKGIPQGPHVSGLLANAYLHAVDRLVIENENEKCVNYFRYTDDIVIMGKTKSDALLCAEKVVMKLRELCLNVNQKTKIQWTSKEKILEHRLRTSYEDATETEEAPEPFHPTEFLEGLQTLGSESKEIKKIRLLQDFLRKQIYVSEYFSYSLIDLLSELPSQVTNVVEYIDYILKLYRRHDAESAHLKLYEKVLEAYRSLDNHRWTRFHLFKILVAHYPRPGHAWVQNEIFRIVHDSDSHPLFQSVAAYYFLHNEDNNAHLKKMSSNANSTLTRTQTAFLLSIKATNHEHLKKLAITCLSDEHYDCNLVGLILAKNLGIEDSIPREKCTDFSSTLLKKASRIQHKETTQKDLLDIGSTLGLNKKPMSSATCPPGTRWENITLKFEDSETLSLHLSGKHHGRFSFEKLGMWKNKKNPESNAHWNFLFILSTCSERMYKDATPGNLSKSLARYSNKSTTIPKTPSATYKQKERLSDALRRAFGVSGNPFHENKKIYKPIFALSPVPTLRESSYYENLNKPTDKQLEKKRSHRADI